MASESSGVGPILRVAVAAPLAELFDYLPPTRSAEGAEPGGAGYLGPGARVLVPFGRGARVGLVVETAAGSDQPPQRLKSVVRALDPAPLLGPADLALVRWAAEYYRHPLGEALFGALPARLRREGPALDPPVPGLAASPAARAAEPAQLELELRRAPAQLRILRLLLETPDGLPLAAVRAEAEATDAAARALKARGLAVACPIPAQRAPSALPGQGDPALQALAGVRTGSETGGSALASGPALNPGQAQAVGAVAAAFGGFAPFLLEGVTGSGKTEVYIRLIREAIEGGRQALVLVPEIGLTPQLAERLARRLPGPIALLHSALDERERERAWRRAAAGEATLALGTRSACFVPLPRLGLIVVDEEHDPSLKQQEGFRYSARDLAVRRAQQAACPVVLGSATPSLETLHNARSGRYRHLELTERAGGAQAPTLSLVDIRGQPLSAGLSPLLREHLAAETASGNQVLLFLNRRGFAPVLTCHDCGWVGGCPHCDARLTFHRRIARLWCHHCGWIRPAPESCPECGSLDLRTLGVGTERLEDELRAVFPDVPLARIDRDSTRRKGALDRVLAAARRGDISILVGTQMLAKGHDFPGVTLVGILDLDQALFAPDFRAPERTAALIVQVAGRAGRAERPGRVAIQTRHPRHPLLTSLLRDGYPGFAELALAEREAARLPPFARLALLRADAPDPEAPLAWLREARRLAEGLLGERSASASAGPVKLLGPVPAPMERRAGRWRAQLLAESPDRSGLQRFLAAWTAALRALPRVRELRWSIDVDPQDML